MIARRLGATTSALIVLSAGGASLLFVPIPLRWQSFWFNALLDLCHLPLFALVGAASARVFGETRGFAVAALLAAAAELLQAPLGRSAEVADVGRGLVGVGLGVLARHAWTRRGARAWGRALLVASALLVWPLAEAIPPLADAIQGAAAFPVLCDFSTPWQEGRWLTGQAHLSRVRDSSNRWAGRILLLPGEFEFSGAEFFPIRRDWRGYRLLGLRFHCERDVQLRLTIRDDRPEIEYHDRYNFTRRFAPGEHAIRLGLDAIRQGPRGRPIDLSWIRSVNLFGRAPQAPFAIDVLEIWLE